MGHESSILTQDCIFLMQTKNRELQKQLSKSVVGENIRFVTIENYDDIKKKQIQGEIATIIIGSDVDDPVQSAQRLYALENNAKIIILAESKHSADNLKSVIKFSPFIGTRVFCLDESNESEFNRVKVILRNSLTARNYRAIMSKTNYQISTSFASQKQVFNHQFINKLMDITPIGIAVVCKRGKILGWNKEAASIFSKNEAQVLGTSLLKLFGQSQSQKLNNFLWNSFEGNGPIDSLEIERTTQESNKQILSFNAAPFTSSKSPEEVYILTIKDITEQVMERKKGLEIQKKHTKELEEKIHERTIALKNANKELLQKNEELVKINKELEAFTYVSSHDLQEPLRKIQTFAGRIYDIENQKLTEKGKMYLSRMQHAASSMQGLIEDLLAFSRLQTSERKFERTDLTTVVEDVKTTFKEIINEKNATVVADEFCDADIIVFLFRQLLHNLISNALKFSKPGESPYIVIKCRTKKGSELKYYQLLPKKMYCHISVSDNGIGFEDEFSNKIFEVFQRLHGKEKYPGTGIGLATVKKIVDIHDGFITTNSEVNKGTTFDVYIPARHA